jgi:hypothetical protein
VEGSKESSGEKKTFKAKESKLIQQRKPINRAGKANQ